MDSSFEKDADIVMFIYREDVYYPESERKNIADIIVAKHGNGPIGEISLYFRPDIGYFLDLALNTAKMILAISKVDLLHSKINSLSIMQRITDIKVDH